MDREALFLNTFHKAGVLMGVGDDGVIIDSTACAIPFARSSTMSCFAPPTRHTSYHSTITRSSAYKISHSTAHNSANAFAHIAHRHKRFVIAADAFVEGVHFKREWLTLTQIAHKAMLVNISDLYAMNATPRYALLSIALPKLTPREIVELANALAQSAKAHHIYFIGGDTISAETLAFHITLFGIPCGKTITRKGLIKGDLVYCSGYVGSSLYALRWLQRGGKITQSKRFARFIAPRLRGEFIRHIARFIHAGLDVSDGILAELARLARLHRKGFYDVKKSRLQAYKSGEEYEMLFAIAKKDKHRLLRIAKRTRTPLEYVAQVGRATKLPKPIIWH